MQPLCQAGLNGWALKGVIGKHRLFLQTAPDDAADPVVEGL
ncbi:hypothetical protein CGMCC3_g9690 [Colletotrichum fructicola]|nr:uncharacterized protein CGMCC3_g9690 [Colletotrichum fructicola]KAE9574232.1 hypothetical protein CGMCC3_g9690 [Colletotrichum fructicola]